MLLLKSFNKKGLNFLDEGVSKDYNPYSLISLIKKEGIDKAMPKAFGCPFSPYKNYHYTLYDCSEPDQNAFSLQQVIALDFDYKDKEYLMSIHKGKLDDYKQDSQAIVTALSKTLPSNSYSLVLTGLGFHVYLFLPQGEVLLRDSFATYKEAVNILGLKIQALLPDFSYDKNLFRQLALLRLPGSNYLEKIHTSGAEVTRRAVCTIVTHASSAFSLKSLPSQAKTASSDTSPRVIVNSAKKASKEIDGGIQGWLSKDIDSLMKPDLKAVEEGCKFLKYCKENQEEVREPEWFAMLSIVGRLGRDAVESRQLAHQYSSKHPSYSELETDNKLTRTLDGAGARTCEGVRSIWKHGDHKDKGCKSCPFYKKIKSPIQIVGDGSLSTQATGFWNVKQGKDGSLTRTTPNYTELLKFFEDTHPYIVDQESKATYLYDKDEGLWSQAPLKYPKRFMELNMRPAPRECHRNEFHKKVEVCNWVEFDNYVDMSYDYILLNNGVYSFKEDKMLKHDPKYFLLNKLGFDYEPEAQCPRFEKFLVDIMGGCKDKALLLKEFMAYALTIGDCRMHKALILIGKEGLNGKSTYTDVLKKMAGKSNYTSIRARQFTRDVSVVRMKHSLFNLAEEVQRKDFNYANDIMKILISGGTVEGKRMYENPVEYENRCKLIFTCNDLPETQDLTGGFKRRFIIVPFGLTFKRDPSFLPSLLEEKSGIFNSLLKARRSLLERGYFKETDDTSKAMMDYMSQHDLVNRWIDDYVIFSDEGHTTSVQCWNSFKMWQEDANIHRNEQLNKMNFFKHCKTNTRLLDRYTRDRLSRGYRIKIKGGGMYAI